MKISFKFPLLVFLLSLSMSSCMMMHAQDMESSSTSDQHQASGVDGNKETGTTAGEAAMNSEQHEADSHSHKSETESHKKKTSTTLYILGGIGMIIMMGLMML